MKIDVCLLQETHVKDIDIEYWSKEWGGSIYCFSGTEHSQGEMILLNKNFKCENVQQIICENRIVGISFLHKDEVYNCFSIYCPNRHTDKINFYQSLSDKIVQCTEENAHLIIGGDFNCVYDLEKDNIVGNPHKRSEISSFHTAITNMNVQDVWRTQHPNVKEFTFRRKNQPISRRLDYIFLGNETVNIAQSSDIIDMPLSDHRGVLVHLSTEKIKYGPNYWKMNDSLLKDDLYVSQVNEIIENTINENRNILNVCTI